MADDEGKERERVVEAVVVDPDVAEYDPGRGETIRTLNFQTFNFYQSSDEGTKAALNETLALLPKNDFGVKVLQALNAAWNYFSSDPGRTDRVLETFSEKLRDIHSWLEITNLNDLLVQKLDTPLAIKKLFLPLLNDADLNRKLALLGSDEPTRVFWNLGRFKQFIAAMAPLFPSLNEDNYIEGCQIQFNFWLRIILLEAKDGFSKWKDENIFISLATHPGTQYLGVPVIDDSKLRLPFANGDLASGQLFIRCKIGRGYGYIQFGAKQMIDAYYTQGKKFLSNIPGLSENEKKYLLYIFENGFLDDNQNVVSKQYALDIYKKAIRDPNLHQKGKYLAALASLDQGSRDTADTITTKVSDGSFKFKKRAKTNPMYRSALSSQVQCPPDYSIGSKFGYSLSYLQTYKRKSKDNSMYYTCAPTINGGANLLLGNLQITDRKRGLEMLILVLLELEKQLFLSKFQFSTTRKGSIVPTFVLRLPNKQERRIALRMVQMRFLITGGVKLNQDYWRIFNYLLPEFLGGTWKKGSLGELENVPIDSIIQKSIDIPTTCPTLIAKYENDVFQDCLVPEDEISSAVAASLTATAVAGESAAAPAAVAATATASATPVREEIRFSSSAATGTAKTASASKTTTDTKIQSVLNFIRENNYNYKMSSEELQTYVKRQLEGFSVTTTQRSLLSDAISTFKILRLIYKEEALSKEEISHGNKLFENILEEAGRQSLRTLWENRLKSQSKGTEESKQAENMDQSTDTGLKRAAKDGNETGAKRVKTDPEVILDKYIFNSFKEILRGSKVDLANPPQEVQQSLIKVQESGNSENYTSQLQDLTTVQKIQELMNEPGSFLKPAKVASIETLISSISSLEFREVMTSKLLQGRTENGAIF